MSNEMAIVICSMLECIFVQSSLDPNHHYRRTWTADFSLTRVTYFGR